MHALFDDDARVGIYHGKLPAAQRPDVQVRFMSGELQQLRWMRHARPVEGYRLNMYESRRSRIVAGASIIAAVTVFALLTVALLRQQLQRLDEFGIMLVDRLRSPFGDVFFPIVTWAGSSFLLVPICFAVAWWVRSRHRLLVAPLLVAPAGAILLQNVLKPLFDRTRPEAGVIAELGPSFPSGHSMASTAVWLALAYVLAREKVIPSYAMLLAPVLPLLVGISRVYLRVHWTSDVIAGWSSGLMIVMASVLLYERARSLETGREAGAT